MKTLNKNLFGKTPAGKSSAIHLNFVITLIFVISFSVYACASKEGTDQTKLVQGNTATTTPDQDEDITDSQITEAINWEYISQDGIYSHTIDVSTKDGIVTLSGVTDNILEKDRAEKIAKMVKGVRAVINKVKVRPTQLDDTDIKKDIENALFKDPATDSYEISVKVNNGKVELEGVVESWQEKQLAAKVAKGVNGVTELENNIAFNYVSDRPDIEIKTDIVQNMRWDVLVDDGLVDVTVDDGNVKLSGTVGSAAEHSQAEVNAWVTGVKSVDASELKVSRWARDEDLRDNKYVVKPDEEIKEAVEDAFLYDPRVYSFNPNVMVESGEVTLTGEVDNLKAKHAAEMIAKNVVGVWKVKNLLKVRFNETYNDVAIESDIEENLLWDPYVDQFEIDVDVNDGVAFLTGEVDNYFEKYHAEDLASATNGVYSVINNILVEGPATPYAYDYDYYYYYPFTRNNTYSTSGTRRDLEVKDDIQEQLWWSPYVDVKDVNVSVEDGVATLTGTVDSWLEYDHAEQNAYDGGAFAVDNDLIVE